MPFSAACVPAVTVATTICPAASMLSPRPRTPSPNSYCTNRTASASGGPKATRMGRGELWILSRKSFMVSSASIRSSLMATKKNPGCTFLMAALDHGMSVSTLNRLS